MKVCFGNEFSQVVTGDVRVVLVPSRSRRRAGSGRFTFRVTPG
jgi:hypothetical protein